jgi:hypothetical protein
VQGDSTELCCSCARIFASSWVGKFPGKVQLCFRPTLVAFTPVHPRFGRMHAQMKQATYIEASQVSKLPGSAPSPSATTSMIPDDSSCSTSPRGARDQVRGSLITSSPHNLGTDNSIDKRNQPGVKGPCLVSPSGMSERVRAS